MKNNNFNFKFMKKDDSYLGVMKRNIGDILDYSDDPNNSFNIDKWQDFVRFLRDVIGDEIDNWLSDSNVEMNSKFKWPIKINDLKKEYAEYVVESNKTEAPNGDNIDATLKEEAHNKAVEAFIESISIEDADMSHKLELLTEEYLVAISAELRDISNGEYRNFIGFEGNGEELIVDTFDLTKEAAIANVYKKNIFFNNFRKLKNQLDIEHLLKSYEDNFDSIMNAIQDEFEINYDEIYNNESDEYRSECYIPVSHDNEFNRYKKFLEKSLYDSIVDITGNLPEDVTTKTVVDEDTSSDVVVFVINNFNVEHYRMKQLLSKNGFAD